MREIPPAHLSLERISPTQKVRSLLKDAVTSHLVADVPVGVFLSGGVDSTAIAALASEAQSGIHTFKQWPSPLPNLIASAERRERAADRAAPWDRTPRTHALGSRYDYVV